jgi:hypothetical protein
MKGRVIAQGNALCFEEADSFGQALVGSNGKLPTIRSLGDLWDGL